MLGLDDLEVIELDGGTTGSREGQRTEFSVRWPSTTQLDAMKPLEADVDRGDVRPFQHHVAGLMRKFASDVRDLVGGIADPAAPRDIRDTPGSSVSPRQWTIHATAVGAGTEDAVDGSGPGASDVPHLAFKLKKLVPTVVPAHQKVAERIQDLKHGGVPDADTCTPWSHLEGCLRSNYCSFDLDAFVPLARFLSTSLQLLPLGLQWRHAIAAAAATVDGCAKSAADESDNWAGMCDNEVEMRTVEAWVKACDSLHRVEMTASGFTHMMMMNGCELPEVVGSRAAVDGGTSSSEDVSAVDTYKDDPRVALDWLRAGDWARLHACARDLQLAGGEDALRDFIAVLSGAGDFDDWLASQAAMLDEFQSALDDMREHLLDLSSVATTLSTVHTRVHEQLQGTLTAQAPPPHWQEFVLMAARREQQMTIVRTFVARRLVTGSCRSFDVTSRPEGYTHIPASVFPLEKSGRLYHYPRGWRKLAIRVPGAETIEDFAEKYDNNLRPEGKWPVGYHGTSAESVGLIVHSTFRTTHGIGAEEKWGSKAVYLSPCIQYCAHPRYSKILRVPSFGGLPERVVQMVLQVRIRPDLLSAKRPHDNGSVIMPGTLPGAHDHQAPMAPREMPDNASLHWLVFSEDDPKVVSSDQVVVVGVMFRSFNSEEELLSAPDNQWWVRAPTVGLDRARTWLRESSMDVGQLWKLQRKHLHEGNLGGMGGRGR
jgi:hypothetical protein